MLMTDMRHQLRVAKPTIAGDDWRRQLQPTGPQGRQAIIEHRPRPAQFVPARRPGTEGVGPTDGKVDRDDQLPIANDSHQQEPINTRKDPMLLTAPPTSNHTQLLPILVEDRVIRGPRPLPAALRRRTLRGHMTPQGDEHLESEAPQPLEPGAFGQGPEQPGGPVFVPAPDATQLRGGATAKEGGKHDPDDFAQELLLTT